MCGNRRSRSEIECALLWRLARRHGWAQWIAVEEIIHAVPTHERGRAKLVAKGLATKPYIQFNQNQGFKIHHPSIDALADELHDVCGFSKFRIEGRLSHFSGFDG